MPSEAFIKGFRYELANRAFALKAVERLAKSLEGTEHFPLWSAYLKLERFNEPRYHVAAANLALDSTPGLWTSFRAWTVALVPKPFHGLLLKFVHAGTVAYVDQLKVLQHEGPLSEQPFLSYMVAQEELQVEMMELAMARRYSEIEQIVADFIGVSA